MVSLICQYIIDSTSSLLSARLGGEKVWALGLQDLACRFVLRLKVA